MREEPEIPKWRICVCGHKITRHDKMKYQCEKEGCTCGHFVDDDDREREEE